MKKIRFVCVLVIIFCAAACQSKGPQSTAANFAHAYYQHADLPAAEALTLGAAKDRIQREIQLRGSGENLPLKSRSVRVYHDTKKVLSDDKQIHAFTIRVKTDDLSFERKSMITVSEQNNKWLVSFFKEVK